MLPLNCHCQVVPGDGCQISLLPNCISKGGASCPSDGANVPVEESAPEETRGSPLATPSAAVGTIHDLAESKDHPFVGGLVQAKMITREGIKDFVVQKSKDSMESWSRSTAEDGEVHFPS